MVRIMVIITQELKVEAPVMIEIVKVAAVVIVAVRQRLLKTDFVIHEINMFYLFGACLLEACVCSFINFSWTINYTTSAKVKRAEKLF